MIALTLALSITAAAATAAPVLDLGDALKSAGQLTRNSLPREKEIARTQIPAIHYIGLDQAIALHNDLMNHGQSTWLDPEISKDLGFLDTKTKKPYKKGWAARTKSFTLTWKYEDEEKIYVEEMRAWMGQDKGQVNYVIAGMLGATREGNKIFYQFRVDRNFEFISGTLLNETTGAIQTLSRNRRPRGMELVLKKWKAAIEDNIAAPFKKPSTVTLGPAGTPQ